MSVGIVYQKSKEMRKPFEWGNPCGDGRPYGSKYWTTHSKIKRNGQVRKYPDFFFLLIMEPVTKRPKRGSKNENAKWGSVWSSFEAIGQSWANAINSPFRKWKVLRYGRWYLHSSAVAHWPNGIKVSKNSISREPCHLIDGFCSLLL